MKLLLVTTMARCHLYRENRAPLSEHLEHPLYQLRAFMCTGKKTSIFAERPKKKKAAQPASFLDRFRSLQESRRRNAYTKCLPPLCKYRGLLGYKGTHESQRQELLSFTPKGGFSELKSCGYVCLYRRNPLAHDEALFNKHTSYVGMHSGDPYLRYIDPSSMQWYQPRSHSLDRSICEERKGLSGKGQVDMTETIQPSTRTSQSTE